MQIRDKRFYTYPVIGSQFNSYATSSFSNDVTESVSGSDLYLLFEAKTDNQEINDLVSEGKAVFVHHIECSKTCYRKAFTTKEPNFEHHINIKDVNGKISISSFIIANIDLERYTNSDFSDDYKGFSFNIPKGGVLAVGDEIVVDVDKKNDELGASKSIFQIVSDKDCTDKSLIRMDLNYDLIRVLIPEKEFAIYDTLQKQYKNMIIYHAMIILPVLSSILYRIQKGDETDDFEDKRWFRVLSEKFDENGKDILSKEYDPYEEAQKIIGYPITESINLMMNQDGGSEDED